MFGSSLEGDGDLRFALAPDVSLLPLLALLLVSLLLRLLLAVTRSYRLSEHPVWKERGTLLLRRGPTEISEGQNRTVKRIMSRGEQCEHQYN